MILEKDNFESHQVAYDIIFMDCNMPVMDGYEATRTIKQLIEQKKINYVPVVSVTAFAGENEKEKCLKAGADEYMQKPFTL